MKNSDFNDAVGGSEGLFTRIKCGTNKQSFNNAVTELLVLCNRYVGGCLKPHYNNPYQKQEYDDIAVRACMAVVKKLREGADIHNPASYVSTTMMHLATKTFKKSKPCNFTDIERHVFNGEQHAKARARDYWAGIIDQWADDPTALPVLNTYDDYADITDQEAQRIKKILHMLQHGKNGKTEGMLAPIPGAGGGVPGGMKHAAYETVLSEYYFGMRGSSYIKALMEHPDLKVEGKSADTVEANIKRIRSDGSRKLKELRNQGESETLIQKLELIESERLRSCERSLG